MWLSQVPNTPIPVFIPSFVCGVAHSSKFSSKAPFGRSGIQTHYLLRLPTLTQTGQLCTANYASIPPNLKEFEKSHHMLSYRLNCGQVQLTPRPAPMDLDAIERLKLVKEQFKPAL